MLKSFNQRDPLGSPASMLRLFENGERDEMCRDVASVRHGITMTVATIQLICNYLRLIARPNKRVDLITRCPYKGHH